MAPENYGGNGMDPNAAAKDTALRTGASEFVPKGRMAKTSEQFPTLGEGNTKADKKKQS